MDKAEAEQVVQATLEELGLIDRVRVLIFTDTKEYIDAIEKAVSYGDFWCMGGIEVVAYPAD